MKENKRVNPPTNIIEYQKVLELRKANFIAQYVSAIIILTKNNLTKIFLIILLGKGEIAEKKQVKYKKDKIAEIKILSLKPKYKIKNIETNEIDTTRNGLVNSFLVFFKVSLFNSGNLVSSNQQAKRNSANAIIVKINSIK